MDTQRRKGACRGDDYILYILLDQFLGLAIMEASSRWAKQKTLKKLRGCAQNRVSRLQRVTDPGLKATPIISPLRPQARSQGQAGVSLSTEALAGLWPRQSQ